MRVISVAAIAVVLMLGDVAAAQQSTPGPAGTPAATPGGPQSPSGSSAGPAGSTQGAAASSTAPGPPRTFTAPVGLLFNTVRAERVADFEKAMAYVQEALAKSSDPRVQAQARGWHMYKASEPGPNNTVLYVFELNPTVVGADYGLGRLLADAFPDQAQLQEIWRLYTGSVTSGGSLLNLTPLMPTLKPLNGPRDDSDTPPATPGVQTPPIGAGQNVPPAQER